MDEDDRGGGGGGRRISKRARRDKSLVVSFDEAARKEFVTGFRKRKNKRRKIAEEKKKENDRHRRLFERKERRLQRKKALGLTDEENAGDNTGDKEEKEGAAGGDSPEKTVVYENDRTRTVVKISDPPSSDVARIKPAAPRPPKNNKTLKLKKRPKSYGHKTEYSENPNLSLAEQRSKARRRVCVYVYLPHQKAKHFKCYACHKKLSTAGGMVVHVLQVHKESITKVPNAKPERESVDIEIYGMQGIPPHILAAHNGDDGYEDDDRPPKYPKMDPYGANAYGMVSNPYSSMPPYPAQPPPSIMPPPPPHASQGWYSMPMQPPGVAPRPPQAAAPQPLFPIQSQSQPSQPLFPISTTTTPPVYASSQPQAVSSTPSLSPGSLSVPTPEASAPASSVYVPGADVGESYLAPPPPPPPVAAAKPPGPSATNEVYLVWDDESMSMEERRFALPQYQVLDETLQMNSVDAAIDKRILEGRLAGRMAFKV